jgi:plasmid stabilization system protein ParE
MTQRFGISDQANKDLDEIANAIGSDSTVAAGKVLDKLLFVDFIQ